MLGSSSCISLSCSSPPVHTDTHTHTHTHTHSLQHASQMQSRLSTVLHRGLPGGSDDKEATCTEGDRVLIPGARRSPGEGNSSPLQCSRPENAMDRGAWRATVRGAADSATTEATDTFRLSQCSRVLSGSL